MSGIAEAVKSGFIYGDSCRAWCADRTAHAVIVKTRAEGDVDDVILCEPLGRPAPAVVPIRKSERDRTSDGRARPADANLPNTEPKM